jgi:hypothetical protein
MVMLSGPICARDPKNSSYHGIDNLSKFEQTVPFRAKTMACYALLLGYTMCDSIGDRSWHVRSVGEQAWKANRTSQGFSMLSQLGCGRVPLPVVELYAVPVTFHVRRQTMIYYIRYVLLYRSLKVIQCYTPWSDRFQRHDRDNKKGISPKKLRYRASVCSCVDLGKALSLAKASSGPLNGNYFNTS